ncbi:hypothetical protein [Vibrio harveyi]|uniref:hypothetical protein n=1 Tax=Vibrio harveyi TaxID=669 RepID=UPI003D7550CC
MTKTEQLQSAWNILKSKKDIIKMFEEVEAKPDEIDKIIKRISTAKPEFESVQKEADLEKVCQMCALKDISAEELIEYMTRPRNAKNGSRNTGLTYQICAVVRGRAISRMGGLPKWAVEEYGWQHRDEIPEEFWTPQHKEHVEAQKAVL